jgi:hypothetical protein
MKAQVRRLLPARFEPALAVRRFRLTVERWEVRDEPVLFAEAVAHGFEPVGPGTPWSKPSGTTWFRLTGTVPDGWDRDDVAIEVPVGLGISARQPGFQAGIHATGRQGRAALADVLTVLAKASAHRVVAVGHAHVDSVWLWPPRETVRKCARIFSNVLNLMDSNPDFVFAGESLVRRVPRGQGSRTGRISYSQARPDAALRNRGTAPLQRGTCR